MERTVALNQAIHPQSGTQEPHSRGRRFSCEGSWSVVNTTNAVWKGLPRKASLVHSYLALKQDPE